MCVTLDNLIIAITSVINNCLTDHNCSFSTLHLVCLHHAKVRLINLVSLHYMAAGRPGIKFGDQIKFLSSHLGD